MVLVRGRLARLLSGASFSSAAAATAAAAAAPSHHRPGGGFRNPPEWRSSRDQGPLDFFRKALPHWDRSVQYTPQPVERVDFAALEAHAQARAPLLRACWLGHVTFLVQSHGLRVLTDPLFSARASPVSFAGPKRFTPAAAQAAELPQPLDAVVISHAHYDPLDEASVRARLALRAPPRSWVVPLGLGAILRAWGAPAERVHERDWYGSVAVGEGGRLQVTVVPAQHGSARTPFDKDATLWGGFYLRFSSSEEGGRGGKTAYFAGDTGYRTVEQEDARGSAAEEAAPRCPAFREMRERLGAPDLALLPIGAYSPRGFMSSVHASPEDAVLMFEDLGARAAVAMHWGALPLTDEPVDAPPARLAAELTRRGHRSDAFVALRCGATWREHDA